MHLFQANPSIFDIFLGAQAPLEIARVKKKKDKKVSNSHNLLYPASTSTLLLAT